MREIGLLKKNGKYDWVLICIISSLLVFSLTLILEPPKNSADISYLLSAISQGLAAIFTLIFTITIFGTQMMGKYTSMDMLIDKWTKCLMIIFAIGIILPLMQLRTDVDLLKLKFINTADLSLAIDFGIATFCILSIIPYLMRVNNVIKYEAGLSKLTEEVFEAVDSNNKVIVQNRITELGTLGKSIIIDNYPNKLNEVIINLKNIGNEVTDKDWGLATYFVLDELYEIGYISLQKRLDKIKGDIFDVSYAVIPKSSHKEQPSKNVLDSIYEIGLKAVDKKLEINQRYIGGGGLLAAEYLSRMIHTAIELKSHNSIIELGSDYLFRIGINGGERQISWDLGEKRIVPKMGIEESLVHSVMLNFKHLNDKKPNIMFKTYWMVLGAVLMKFHPDEAKGITIDRYSFVYNNDVLNNSIDLINNSHPELINELKDFLKMLDKVHFQFP